MPACSLELVRQHSRTPCLLNTSFGCYDDNPRQVWTRACRGTFACDGALDSANHFLCGYPPGEEWYNCSCDQQSAVTAARDSDEAKFGAASWQLAASDTYRRHHIYRRVQFWIGLLLASPDLPTGLTARRGTETDYSRFWRNGTVPPLGGRGARRSRVHCPGTLRSAAARDSASYCDALWPAQAGEPCAVYVIGIGGEWTFAEYALSKGCEVHAYDPTVELRARHLLRSRLYALVLPGHTQSLLLPSRWPRLASVIGVFSSKSRSRLPLPLGTGAAPHE